jgi:hypothetical protein
MNSDLTHVVRRALAQHGVPDAVSAHVWTWSSPAGDDGWARANLTIGHGDEDRRRETAMISFEDETALVEHVSDRSRVAAFICLGVGAMPASARPDLPDWIASSEEARRTRSDLRRASALADGAVRGEKPDPAPSAPGTPF